MTTPLDLKIVFYNVHTPTTIVYVKLGVKRCVFWWVCIEQLVVFVM